MPLCSEALVSLQDHKVALACALIPSDLVSLVKQVISRLPFAGKRPTSSKATPCAAVPTHPFPAPPSPPEPHSLNPGCR